MKNSIYSICLLTSFLLATTIPVEAKAKDCKQVSAQIISSLTKTGCTSPVGLCTAGTIDGNRGLDGSTFFTVDSTAPGPSTAANAAATISYSGVLKVTTEQGTVTFRDSGLLDGSTGTAPGGFFSSFDIVIDGTGKFQGATGDLFIGGKTIAGHFVTTVITGELCLP